MKKKYPLMKNNITREDLDQAIKLLKKKDPILTSNINVEKFEKNWSKWLGVKYSVFVNSGSSSNLLTLSIIKNLYSKGGEIIVPSFTWSSDISAVILNGFTPKFVDIDLRTLSMENSKIIQSLNKKTVAVFLSHIQGFSGITDDLINELNKRKIILLEDVCESHGASHKDKKLGTFGLISNFSFYYAHHISTIEGGMLCTNDSKIYQIAKIIRAHGMVRESTDKKLKSTYYKKFPNLNPEFIFAYPAYNFRNNEIGAVIGQSQLKRLDKNIEKRNKNHLVFLENLNKELFYTNFNLNGSSNYAFNLILKNKDMKLFKKICSNLKKSNIEFRIGSAGGGNQIRQPYLIKYYKKYINHLPYTEHVHFYGMYIGNYPDLTEKDIKYICKVINNS